MKRGQVSIETLLVFLIFLSVLGVAYAAASKIAAGSQERVQRALSEKSFNEFSDKAAQACFLGNGNVRIVEAEGGAANISADGTAVHFESAHFRGSFSTNCISESKAQQPATRIRIENKEGVIEIS